MATVLVVDDDDDMRALVRMTLEGTPHTVIGEAPDGETALAAWRELEPDVIVLDHLMPTTTGLEVAAAILRDQAGQRLVLYTVATERALFQQAEHLGVAACVAKSDIAHLADVIATVACEPGSMRATAPLGTPPAALPRRCSAASRQRLQAKVDLPSPGC